MVGAALLIFVAGLLFGELLGYWRSKPQNPQFAAAKPASRFPFSWKPEPKPEEKPRPVGSIPRSAGPWRRQRLAFQKAHNSKQKERDALIKEQPNVSTQAR